MEEDKIVGAAILAACVGFCALLTYLRWDALGSNENIKIFILMVILSAFILSFLEDLIIIIITGTIVTLFLGAISASFIIILFPIAICTAILAFVFKIIFGTINKWTIHSKSLEKYFSI